MPFDVIRPAMSLSARRAWIEMLAPRLADMSAAWVALRKESVDRNLLCRLVVGSLTVALRKESVDRNCIIVMVGLLMFRSLSARRAWIEICGGASARPLAAWSLSARRAWIEICCAVWLLAP